MILRFSAIALAVALCAPVLVSAQGAAPTKLTYNLVAQNNSGETGTITITPTADGKGSVVLVETKGQGPLPQPIHFHMGLCAARRGTDHPLKTLEGGKSGDDARRGPRFHADQRAVLVNVHKSTTEGGIYVACADIPKRQ